MSDEKPGRLGQGQEGSNFAAVLRKCLVCGIIVVDDKERIASLTTEAGQILGLDPRQALHASFEVLPESLRELVREVVRSGRPLDGRPLLLSLPRGETRRVRASGAPIDCGRQVPGVALVLNDLTPAKQLEQNIWRMDRLASIGTLAASMAHEIKNALVAGKTFIDLLLEKHQDAELVDIVRREMSRIDAIVSRMLKFTTPSRETFGAVHVHEVLEHSLRLVQPQLESKSIRLERSFEAAPDLVHGDDYELQQAFVNLLLNALEAMGPNGTLTIATELLPAADTGQLRETSEAQQLRLSIKDTGAGVSPENMARLFEPFFTTKPSGTGLGLAITQKLIEEHRGSISVQSAPNRGTTFEIRLPARGAET